MEKQELLEKLNEQVEKAIENVLNEKVQPGNADYLYKLMDIHKDIKNEKEEKEMYRDYGYGEYGEGYGRRGVPGTGRRRRYRGEDALDEMKYHYGNYQDSYNTGNYNGKDDSSYKMTEAFKEFIFAVGEELEPKDKQMFKQAMQEMVQKI